MNALIITELSLKMIKIVNLMLCVHSVMSDSLWLHGP